jgi:AcrR family transcriptional regulator
VAAAWQIAAEAGLAGITMRDLGERVGMRAQSLYSYVGSKFDIYDAMFAEGYRAFHDVITVPSVFHDPADIASDYAQRYFEFCVADPVRFQLLFLRTIPGFTPSADSYAIALAVLDDIRSRMAAVGVDDPAAVDLWTAVMTGLASQQIANDPGGTRWHQLLEPAVDMLLAATQHQPTPLASARRMPT